MANVVNFSGEFETGRVTVGTSAVQLPNVHCRQVQLKAINGSPRVGNSSAVTTVTGYTMTNTQPPPVIVVDNLNQIWVIGNIVDISVEFLAMR